VVFSGGVEERVKGLVGYELLEEAPVAGKEERIRVCELTEIQEISKLVGLLESQDPMVRSKAIELLALSRNADSIEPVLVSLEDPDEGVRVAAAKGLSHLPTTSLSEGTKNEVIDRISRRLGDENSQKVLASLILAFGKFCSDLRLLKLGGFLTPERPDRLVANAAEALGPGSARFKEIQDLLVPLLSSRSNRVKANVAKALFLAGRHEVIEALTPMLMHSDPLMRASGVWAMGELASALPTDAPWLFEGLLKPTRTGATDAIQPEVESWQKEQFSRLKPLLAALQASVPMLVGLLKDEDPRVKRQAISALGKIQDRSALLPLIDSVDFLRDSREVLLEVSQALRSIGAHRLVREVVDRLT
jgi:HEAT repeat protein